MAKKVSFTVSFDPVVMRRIDRMTKSLGISRSAWFQRVVARELDESEFAAKAFTDPAIMGPLMQAISDPDWIKRAAKAFGEGLTDEQASLFSERFRMLGGEGKQKKGK